MKFKILNYPVVAILHNIRSLHNVGSMFRTADGAGIKKLYLSGYTGYPPRPEIAKTALGAEEFVPWERYGHVGKLIEKLREEGYVIAAIENGKLCRNAPRRVQNMPWHVPTKKPIAFIVGNEVKGLSKKVLEKADVILEIPMRGQKESLNVSVAFGIIAYELTPRSVPRAFETCRGNGKHL